MNIETESTTISNEDTALSEKFERWLKTTCEPFDDWTFDGENYVVYAAGKDPEIYEPALVRELVEGLL